jgi:tetratricopeptide (TPR) repeat protein
VVSRGNYRQSLGIALLMLLASRPAVSLGADRLPPLPHPWPPAVATSASERWTYETENQLLLAALAADPWVTLDEQRHFRQQLNQRLAECQQFCGSRGSDWHRAEAVFEFVHSRLLTGPYDDGCARVQRTLADGTHNCLTATLFYLTLVRRAGIPAVPLAAPGHVAVRVWLGQAAWDVETTNSRWSPAAGVERGGRLTEISDSALVGRVYYNLGIRLAHAGDYERALAATRHSVQLDPQHLEAQGNLLATLNNWSIDLVRRGQYEQAQAMIQEGLRLDGQYTPLRQSEAFLQQQRRLAADR